MREARIARLACMMWGQPKMDNRWRAVWAEALVEDLLAPDWKYVGADWGGVDLQNEKSGHRP